MRVVPTWNRRPHQSAQFVDEEAADSKSKKQGVLTEEFVRRENPAISGFRFGASQPTIGNLSTK
jgi:hypothetical protein